MDVPTISNKFLAERDHSEKYICTNTDSVGRTKAGVQVSSELYPHQSAAQDCSNLV